MKRKIKVLQEEISDCGVCCLLSIIRYYGGNASLEKLRYESYTTKEGVNAYNLIECSKIYGFDAKGIKTESLDNVLLPCIAHIKVNNSLSHFIVIYEAHDNYYEIMDPSIGFKRLSKDKFHDIFLNTIITLYPKNKIPDYNNENTLFKHYIKTLQKNKYIVMKLIILNIVFIFLAIISSFSIKMFMSNKNIYYLSLFFLLIIIIKSLINYFTTKITILLQNKIKIDTLSNFFKHIFKLPLKYLHIKDAGEIIKRVDDLSVVNEHITNSLISIILNIIIIIPLLGVICLINKYIFGLTILYMFLFIGITFLTNKNVSNKIKNVITSSTDYNNYIVNYITSLETINHANASYYCHNNLIKSLNSYTNDENIFIKYVEKGETLKNIIMESFQLIINFIFMTFILKNQNSFENLIALNTLMGIYMHAITDLSNIIPNYLYIHNIFIKANDFYNFKEASSGNKSFILGDININNLTFSYNGISNVLNNINACIPSGSKVLLKGSSGCGKSTLCRLLNKEYIDYMGSIKINGEEIKNILTSDIKEHITYASQNEKIVIGTIKDNITLGKDISEDEFIEVCKMCFVDLIVNDSPFRYDTFLYGGGEELSGGERQRIILARTLLTKRDIIILDESLSEVNEELEYQILNNIFKTFPRQTIIYISHKNQDKMFKQIIYV